ncbi:MAG: helix-turn-helix domain-containing protein [Candidatus Thiodiazotropha sp. (ex. Lucinisca nassula)]|nr:helix-turn-helix domain-containing protein [Candidatus Thiodiazotropha sp. (ex. Lucinisca nassula)]
MSEEQKDSPNLARLKSTVGDRMFVTIPEVIRFSGVGRTKLWEMRRDGTAPPFQRIGGRLVVQVDVLADWLDSQPTESRKQH